MYSNDAIWLNLRALGPLSKQIAEMDGEEDVGYVRCMTAKKDFEDEYKIGRQPINKTSKPILFVEYSNQGFVFGVLNDADMGRAQRILR